MRPRVHNGPLCCGQPTWLIADRPRAKVWWCDVCGTQTVQHKGEAAG